MTQTEREAQKRLPDWEATDFQARAGWGVVEVHQPVRFTRWPKDRGYCLVPMRQWSREALDQSSRRERAHAWTAAGGQ